MNKGKLIGILVASVGVVASFATAYSLYTKDVDPVDFGIGAQTHTGSTDSVTYQINNASSPSVQPSYLKKNGTNGGEGLSEIHRVVKYEFALGADYADTLTTQDYVVGKLTINLTNINASIRNKVKLSLKMDGYIADSLGEHYYGGYRKTTENTDIHDMTLAEASLAVRTDDIAVSSAGTQKLVAEFVIDDSIDAFEMNELSNLWNISVRWEEPSENFTYAYFRSDKTEWESDDEFVMAPNIGKPYNQGWEWTCQVTGIADSLTIGKPYIYDAEAEEDQRDHWAGDREEWIDQQPVHTQNLVLADGVTYDVYWSGTKDAVFYANEKASS